MGELGEACYPVWPWEAQETAQLREACCSRPHWRLGLRVHWQWTSLGVECGGNNADRGCRGFGLMQLGSWWCCVEKVSVDWKSWVRIWILSTCIWQLGLTMQFWLSWNSPCRPGCPWTHRALPTSASQLLGWKACATIPGWILFFKAMVYAFGKVRENRDSGGPAFPKLCQSWDRVETPEAGWG